MKPNNLRHILLEDNYEYKHLWRSFLTNLFGKTYEVLYTKNILGLLLIIFVKKEIKNELNIKVINCDIIRLGKLNFANKASIFIQLSINYEEINIFNCHLASGTKTSNCSKRINNLKKIFKTQEANNESVIDFIMGDLNFRNKTTSEKAWKLIESYGKYTEQSEKSNVIQKLLSTEELTNILAKEDFKEIKEEKIEFLPSYKFFPGTNKYNLREGKRVPSHTDRVLYIQKEEGIMVDKSYIIEQKTNISDHKPVIFTCKFRAIN